MSFGDFVRAAFHPTAPIRAAVDPVGTTRGFANALAKNDHPNSIWDRQHHRHGYRRTVIKRTVRTTKKMTPAFGTQLNNPFANPFMGPTMYPPMNSTSKMMPATTVTRRLVYAA